MWEIFFIFFRLFFSSKTQQVLVVFQNNNELRGGGGFITQLLDISIGRLKFKMNFRHDHNDLQPKKAIVPPEEITKYLKLSHWFFRDANLFGDFSKNAEHLKMNYQTIYQENQVAAVFAVNFSFVESLLKVSGKVKVENQVFTCDNLFYELTTKVSNIDNHDVYVHNQNKDRKSILKVLLLKLIRVIIVHFWKWPALLKLIRESFVNKDLQVHSFNPKEQQRLLKKQLAESFSNAGAIDCLAIVENNYLGLKSNRYLRRSVFHDVKFHLNRQEKTLSEATVRVKISTEHFGSFNYPLSGGYQSVINIFIPESAENIKLLTDGLIISTNQVEGFKVLYLHKIFNIGTVSEINFEYQLPARLFQNNHYSFHYIKQSGVKHEHLFETVSYPDQFEIETDNQCAIVNESKLFLEQVNLDRSYTYSIQGQFHLRSPRIFYHEIYGPSWIQIRFNEPVFYTPGSPQSERLSVTDVQNGNLITVERSHFDNDNRHLYIYVPDMPRIDECFYRVKLAHIQNQVGVIMQPTPREVTVVYRSRYYRTE